MEREWNKNGTKWNSTVCSVFACSANRFSIDDHFEPLTGTVPVNQGLFLLSTSGHKRDGKQDRGRGFVPLV
jgi:hypothetical protein